MTVRRNILVVASILGLTLGASAALVSPGALPAVVFSGVVAGLNAVAAHYLVLRCEGRPGSAFVKLVLGGMAIRMFAVVGAVVAGLLAGLDAMPLVVSLLGHFVVFLALEMMTLRSPASLAAGTR